MKVGGASFDAALREMIGEFERRSGLAVRVGGELAGLELSANAQIHVLQIVREALTNVEKHARARLVSVALQRGADGSFEVAIEDDGVGIDTDRSPAQHFGLDIMRDRARLLGGSVQIGRRSGGGTRVQLRVAAPIAVAAPAPAAAAPAPAAAAPAPTRQTA
jgi:two-component system nitrate/nitrite sensor histidine kinase NarX